ncbi:hypothetical protein [Cohnella terricola]|uniref:DUF2802 domain-containing protein n=1 Tax=Cohnella terricola TaxID=1289167 RepID=A0A559JCQ2_9BACL|nr:hypothetical protein [Cohnella terricola]TVX97637.1 hypothetical protein FPZ45_17850 [Cohnella terricola]
MEQPWLYIVLLGAAITVYAWMLPRNEGKDKETNFVSEDAYTQLLEDLEAENRELFDAVAKFKQEHDDTTGKLSRRVVELENQMKKWSEQPSAVAMDSRPPVLHSPSIAALESATPQIFQQSSLPISDEGRDPAVTSAESESRSGSLDVETVDEQSEEPIVPEITIRGRYPELLELHDKGKSIEQIAKATGMNKGEVQLILQLARREERQHA